MPVEFYWCVKSFIAGVCSTPQNNSCEKPTYDAIQLLPVCLNNFSAERQVVCLQIVNTIADPSFFTCSGYHREGKGACKAWLKFKYVLSLSKL